MEVKLGNITIEVKDFVEGEDDGEVYLYITDSEVKEADFEDFLSFFKQYSEKDQYFTTIFDGHSFFGRFGRLYYSKSDSVVKMRLVFVKSHADTRELPGSNFVVNDASYRNTKKALVKSDLILSNLLSVLEEKGILSATDLKEITTVDEASFDDRFIRMNAEIDDLHKYLKEEYNTLDDIRKKQC
ncbi:hypothetical protein CBR56_28965 [Bacillus thuringiensis]|uniref:hypothetical protein n=1 Tax=Bacillus tropicus TaxID=2026188 RepID=UPI000B446856|nr:hypothetical protein [Bacillus tropicus]MED3038589.1 hypothetical protein [Bacillus tropicus]OTX91875.1 hypothetical protein BK728_00515 [Bacillus thuringiensis serovar chanpaisis]PNK22582.1 hypothetical protein CBR56_28965 [Bacillus thuringiensis]